MLSYLIEQKRIISLSLPVGFDVHNIKVGIPVLDRENEKLNLSKVGGSVLPAATFGSVCRKNAEGYSSPDKSKPKERRYICTNWIRPYGNEDASEVPCDIYKKCYPKVVVPPTEIEFALRQGSDEKEYIIAELPVEQEEDIIKIAVNMFLEVFGKCYVFSGEIKIIEPIETFRCNWQILPPEKRPSEYLSELKIKKYGAGKSKGFQLKRLQVIEEYPFDSKGVGTNGFMGYYAYLHRKCCVLESAIYGNATYIIPSENWEALSQKTKKELLDSKNVIRKITHKANWESEFRMFMEKNGITKS